MRTDLKYLLPYPASYKQLLGSSGTTEPDRTEAVLGFSLQRDTHCRRLQLSVLRARALSGEVLV